MARQDGKAGRVGRVLIGLGLMLLALRLITESTLVLTQSEVVRTLLMALTSDITLGGHDGRHPGHHLLLQPGHGAAGGHAGGGSGIPTEVALGLVVGANLGSGLLAVLTTMRSSIQARQVPLGNLLFRMVAATVMIPGHRPVAHAYPDPDPRTRSARVVLFHLAFNIMGTLLCLPITGLVATAVGKILRQEEQPAPRCRARTTLDASALSTPSLAISCAAREGPAPGRSGGNHAPNG